MAWKLSVFLQLPLVVCLVFGGADDHVPVGHLKPFGAHTPPSEVEERYDLPTAKEFWEKYAKRVKPVVFRGVNKVSPALTKWTDDYLKDNYGDTEVRIEQKREIDPRIPEGEMGLARDTLRNFINTYHNKENIKYIISELPTSMYKDFLVPPFVSCGPFPDRLVEVDLWIGGGGSSSKIHKDAFHIINCLHNGTKEWKMIESKYEKEIYKVPEEPGRLSGYSTIDPLKVDLLKYPNAAKVPWSFTTVNPGDCMYVPKSMFHQVRSFGTHNLAVSLLFSRFDGIKDLNFSDCSSNSFKPLSEFDPDWPYPGHGPFSMGNADLEYGTREELLSSLDKNNKTTLKRIRNSIKQVETFTKTGRTDKDVDRLVKEFYELFNKTEKDEIHRDDIQSLKKKQLRIIAGMFAVPDPYNTDTYEYYKIDSLEILRVLVRLLKKKGVVNKQLFLDRYIVDLGGSNLFAKALFKSLGGVESESISKDIIIKNVDNALKNYDERELLRHMMVEYGQSVPFIRKYQKYSDILKSQEPEQVINSAIARNNRYEEMVNYIQEEDDEGDGDYDEEQGDDRNDQGREEEPDQDDEGQDQDDQEGPDQNGAEEGDSERGVNENDGQDGEENDGNGEENDGNGDEEEEGNDDTTDDANLTGESNDATKLNTKDEL